MTTTKPWSAGSLVLALGTALAACRDDAATAPAEGSTSTDDGSEGDTGGTDSGDSTGDTGVDAPTIEPLSPVAHLVRASMALRGIRPSLTDLHAVADDPDALPDLVDGYLQDPSFGATVRDMHNEALLMRADIRPDLFAFPILPQLGVDESVPESEFSANLWEAPLRLVEHVVMNDLPYSEILTADYLVANAPVAAVWGLEHDGSDAWIVTHWPDGRPAAGILADSGLFNRHKSMGSNYQRGRANAIRRALLCSDFLGGDIQIEGSIDLSDPDAVSDAVKTNPACTACHANLDPLASYFWGHDDFHLAQEITSYPIAYYQVEREPAWMFTTETAPAFFGQTGERLDDLAAQIAAEEEFSRCAVKRFYSYLTETPLAAVDDAIVDEFHADFVADGLDARRLARAIVLSDDFTVSHAVDDEGVAAEVIGYQKARPRQLARMFLDLTGFGWYALMPTSAPTDPMQPPPPTVTPLLANSFFGFEVLAGGIDSYYSTLPTHTTNPTASLVLRELAAQAAAYVVEADFAVDPDERRLLAKVAVDGRDEATIRDQLVDLHLRLYGEIHDADSDSVDDAWALFSDALAQSDDVRQAWKVTLTAMLQDFAILHS